MPDINQSLTRDDLVLLMESYRNTIALHQAILDQTTKGVEMQNVTITKLDALTTKQSVICNELNAVTRALEEAIKTSERRYNKLEGISEALTGHEKKSIEEHGKIATKIYIAMAGMGTIILSLIGLGYTIYNVIKGFHLS